MNERGDDESQSRRYDEGCRHFAAGAYSEAGALFAQILAREPTYRDAAALLEEARRRTIDALIAAGKTRQAAQRSVASPSTGTSRLRVGAIWCTSFGGLSLRMLNHWPLKHMWRGASQFLGGTLKHGQADVTLIRFDDELQLDALDGASDRIANSVDLIYAGSHGQFEHGEFHWSTASAEWYPVRTEIGATGPKIAVFEACDLIVCGREHCTIRQCDWRSRVCAAVPFGWSRPEIGPALRFVLGFASPATIDRKSTRRGHAFAENLFRQRLPIANAWLQAVHQTTTADDVAIAMAFGDDESEAENLLRTARITDPLPPRNGQLNHVAWRVCH